MKLYDVPRNTKVKIAGDSTGPVGSRCTQEEDVFNFHSIDGMYSYCTDKENNVVHLAAWTEVEIVE